MKKLKANQYYRATVSYLQFLEEKGFLTISSHSAAQKMTTLLEYETLSKQQSKIVTVLINCGRSSAKDIAEMTGLKSKVVSAQLNQIKKNTLLLSVFKINKKNKEYDLANKNHFNFISLNPVIFKQLKVAKDLED